MSYMIYSEVEKLAADEMRKWGLTELGWTFLIDNPKRRLGQCNYGFKTISVSKGQIDHDPIDSVHQTILHEIAHALHYIQYDNAGKTREFLPDAQFIHGLVKSNTFGKFHPTVLSGNRLLPV